MTDIAHDLLAWVLALRFAAGAALCLVGGCLALVGAIGVLRFPDFYTRLHAASVTDTGGATLVLVGMALMAPGWLVAAKVLAIFVFLYLTGPTSSHVVASAAHTAGLRPLIGAEARRRPETPA